MRIVCGFMLLGAIAPNSMTVLSLPGKILALIDCNETYTTRILAKLSAAGCKSMTEI